MRDALKRSRVVFQLGHHARQATCALQAKELLAQEILGPVTLVRTGRFKASDPAHPNWRWYGYYDQWNRPDPAQVVKDVNWDLWLGPAPKIPWNERHFWHWRCYSGLGELHPKPRHAEMLDRRGLHRNRDLPHVAGFVPAAAPGALGRRT